MLTFEKKGTENTKKALEIAIDEAIKRNTDLVIATTTGQTAIMVEAMAKEKQFKGKIIAVSHAYGFGQPGQNTLSEELRCDLENKGIIIVTATHVLSGAERGLSNKYQGVYPVQIIADTLRMLSQGIKVCVEISVMALDAGKISYGQPIVCVGGSGRGADTVAIVTPAHGNRILDTKINDILAKPFIG